jgi:hypothetical protein
MQKQHNEAFLLEKLVDKYEEISEAKDDKVYSVNLLLLLLLKDAGKIASTDDQVEGDLNRTITSNSSRTTSNKSTAASETSFSSSHTSKPDKLNRALIKEFISKEECESYFPEQGPFKVTMSPYAYQPQFLVSEIFKNSETVPEEGNEETESLHKYTLPGLPSLAESSQSRFFKVPHKKQ